MGKSRRTGNAHSVLKKKGRGRGDKRTLGDPIWVAAVRCAGLTGASPQRILDILGEQGLYVPARSTLIGYLRHSDIPGLSWRRYQKEANKVSEFEERIKKAERDNPRFHVWRNLTAAMLRNGCSLTSIESELNSRDLHPHTINAIQRCLAEGMFYEMTPKLYEQAVAERRQKKQEQWVSYVHPMARQGYSETEIRAKLMEKKIKPDSLSTIQRYISAGKVPGLSFNQYVKLVAERKFQEKDKWVSIVREGLDRGDSLAAIQKSLQAAGLPQNDPKTIVRMIQDGHIPGYTWDKKNNPLWNHTVFDILYQGCTIEKVHKELVAMGMHPFSVATIKSRIQSGSIHRTMEDGTVCTMDADLYADRVRHAAETAPNRAAKF